MQFVVLNIIDGANHINMWKTYLNKILFVSRDLSEFARLKNYNTRIWNTNMIEFKLRLCIYFVCHCWNLNTNSNWIVGLEQTEDQHHGIIINIYLLIISMQAHFLKKKSLHTFWIPNILFHTVSITTTMLMVLMCKFQLFRCVTINGNSSAYCVWMRFCDFAAQKLLFVCSWKTNIVIENIKSPDCDEIK